MLSGTRVALMAKLTIDRDRVTPALQSLGLRNESALLVATRTISHTEAARRLGIPKQTFQDWRDESVKDVMLVFAAYGLKLVPIETEAYASDDIAAMAHLAQKGLISMKPLPRRAAVVEEDGDTEAGALGER